MLFATTSFTGDFSFRAITSSFPVMIAFDRRMIDFSRRLFVGSGCCFAGLRLTIVVSHSFPDQHQYTAMSVVPGFLKPQALGCVQCGFGVRHRLNHVSVQTGNEVHVVARLELPKDIWCPKLPCNGHTFRSGDQ